MVCVSDSRLSCRRTISCRITGRRSPDHLRRALHQLGRQADGRHFWRRHRLGQTWVSGAGVRRATDHMLLLRVLQVLLLLLHLLHGGRG